MSTLIVAAILMAVIIIPFLLMRSGIKKHEKELYAELTDLAQKNNTEIGQYDVLKDIAVATDKSVMKLLFIHKNEHLATTQTIDLNVFTTCQLEKGVKVIHSESGDRTIIEKISLLFKSVDRKNAPITLELFNTDYDSLTLAGELQLAEKWAALVNNRA